MHIYSYYTNRNVMGCNIHMHVITSYVSTIINYYDAMQLATCMSLANFINYRLS